MASVPKKQGIPMPLLCFWLAYFLIENLIFDHFVHVVWCRFAFQIFVEPINSGMFFSIIFGGVPFQFMKNKD